MPYENQFAYLYLWSLVIAIGLTVLLWAIFLYVVQIKYGGHDKKLTRLTRKPYPVLWMALTSMMLEGVILGDGFTWLWD